MGKIDEFNKLHSSSTWSFPPRPWTHHVRWIEPDVNNKDYIFVAIEAGALIKISMEVSRGKDK
ncbi:MAG: hypothetical protein P0116_13870 [Candidatus Nitrosocosmicus sp.]|nr:hypothetical protein [Candidatus Nitrosocosmicus sp.]